MGCFASLANDGGAYLSLYRCVWLREYPMAYAASAGTTIAPVAAPGLLALQRALVWLVGASGAIVFIEPSPYEIATLLATVVFLATGLRMRLLFMPLLLLLLLLNVGYTMSAVAVMDQPGVAN